MKKLLLLLTLLLALIVLPATVSADEADTNDYVYISISFDGQYIEDTDGEPIMYYPVSMADIEAIDLAEYGLENMLFDPDGDGNYETTALQLIIYAHETLYGGSWDEVDFSAYPGSSYFSEGVFGFTENLVYFHNGDFPVDETQSSPYYTVGATSDRIVLKAGDFLDIASFSCYAFLWDTLGGFRFFGDTDGNYVHEYQLKAGQELPVRLIHSFCDLMSGSSYTADATDFALYYGTVYGEAEGTVTTDENGMAQILFEQPGTYYLWCYGGNGAEESHYGCDYYYEAGEPCIVSAPAYARIIVSGEAEPEAMDFSYARMILGNALEFQFALEARETVDWTGAYAVIEKDWADGTTTEKNIPVSRWGSTVIDGKQYWAIVYDTLAAKEMADTFRVTVYDAQGEAITNTHNDSVRAYVERAYGSQTAEGKTMMVDMLNYGAAAQVHFGYGTDDLANNKLTDAQKAVGTAAAPEMSNDVVKGTNYNGTRFILQSRIQVQVGFKNMTSDMYATYTYVNARGETMTVRVDGKDFIMSGAKAIGIELSELVYADARTLVDIVICKADGTVHATASDSVESACARSEGDVFSALLKFADSAKAYLY